VVAVDVVRVPRQPSARVDCEREGVVFARCHEVLAPTSTVLASHLILVAYAAREWLHRHAPAEPPVGSVARVHRLVLAAHGRWIGPAIDDDAAVDRRGHVADDSWSRHVLSFSMHSMVTPKGDAIFSVDV
jgi:hypothetical protein